MKSEVFDLLVIGAGPAGSFAAEHLARAGKRVALFDGRPPREAKACGGGVTTKALKAWPHLLKAAGRSIEQVEMYSPNGRRIHLQLAEPFAIYSRRHFDSYLRRRAQEAGAQVFAGRVSVQNEKATGGVWTVKGKNGERWSGRVLVAADGANSHVAKRLAGALPPSEMEVAFGYRAPLPKDERDAVTVIAFLPHWSGYAWAFPRLDHLSFGIATTQNNFDHKSLDALLWSFMTSYYTAGDGRIELSWTEKEQDGMSERRAEVEAKLRLSVERYAARIPGLSVETWEKRRAAGKDWALLGDAAGFADPVTGEGIYYALRSAELFAEAYLRGDVSSYEKSWRADFGDELRRAAKMRDRFYGTFLGAPFTERMIQFAHSHRGIRNVLGELIAGEQGYIDLKSKLARRAFFPL